MKAKIVEIMETIQGEGLLLGSRQVFVRFAGCNLRCGYCDTPESFEPPPYCLVHKNTGRGGFEEQEPNPLSADRVLELVKQYSSQWISLTGGEPLLWADYICDIGKILKNQGYNILLETNGTLYEQLDQCLPYIDLISMDYKLASATGVDCSDMHARFLISANNRPVYVKMVIDKNAGEEEIRQAIEIIATVNKSITLILQPVTTIGDISPPDIERLLELQKMCRKKIPDVRIIPQIHKSMGIV